MNELEIECLQSVWSPVQIKKILKKRQYLTNKRFLLILNFFKNIIQSIEKVNKNTLLQVHFRDNLKASPEKCSKKIFSSNSLRSPNNTIIKKNNNKQTNKKINKTKKIWDIYNKMFFVINPPVISSPQWNKHPLI